MGWLKFIPKLVPIVVGAVQAVESIVGSGKKGKEKQDAAVNAIEAMIPTFQLALPEGVFRSNEFQKLLRELIDSYVAIENFIAKVKEKD